MSNYAGRITLAKAFEQEVAEALRALKWDVQTYGQQDFRRELRAFLRDEPAVDRWRPDFVARRDGQVRLIDPKTCTEHNRASVNYSIEKASVSAMVAHEQITGWPVLLVMHDWKVIPAKLVWELVERDELREIPYSGYGSGTPGWLLPKATCLLDFQAVFGVRCVT